MMLHSQKQNHFLLWIQSVPLLFPVDRKVYRCIFKSAHVVYRSVHTFRPLWHLQTQSIFFKYPALSDSERFTQRIFATHFHMSDLYSEITFFLFFNLTSCLQSLDMKCTDRVRLLYFCQCRSSPVQCPKNRANVLDMEWGVAGKKNVYWGFLFEHPPPGSI